MIAEIVKTGFLAYVENKDTTKAHQSDIHRENAKISRTSNRSKSTH